MLAVVVSGGSSEIWRRKKGSVFEAVYRRLLPRNGSRIIIWKLLHHQVRYVEFGNRPNPEAVKRRLNRLTPELRCLGYAVQLTPLSQSVAT